jgi:hypothetical protein
LYSEGTGASSFRGARRRWAACDPPDQV